ncbi:MAG: hypothetical protein IH591_03685, partial [Bacteroidales bacterium]|nr:hypothetical protein [Bacteroidales bacterium]
MKRISLLAILIFAILMPLRLKAQFYDTGTDPASLRWKQITTENFRLVFPSDYEKEAARTAALLEEASERLNNIYRLPSRRPKLDILIHNHSIESNGYVAIAPYRMELYPTPEQNSLPVDFRRRLINHEMVHVKQISALQTGVTGVLSRFGGQQYTGIVAAMLPFWFLEGDGIIYETLLTPGGRGTNPSFNKELKALYMGKPGGYSFDKMLLGSYRHHTPSHYHYGFRMMEFSRSKSGNNLWKDNVSYVASKPFLINPLNFSLRKQASTTKKKLFTETFDEFSKLWHYESQLDAPVEYTVVNPSKNDDYINYYSPIIIGSDSLIAFKSSYSEPLSIVLIDKDLIEKRILYTGWVDPYFLSYGGGKMAWAEIQGDIRWENRGFSIIAVHDLASGVTSRITRRSRLFAPAMSPDGYTIAAIETTTTNQSTIVFIDAVTGIIKDRLIPPGNSFPQRPAWSDDGTSIS